MTIVNLFGEEDNEPQLAMLFERFWRAYPRRVGKGAARKSFERALRYVDCDTLMAATELYASRTDQEAKFIPYPSTWLNQERWADDPPPVVSLPAPGARIPPPPATCGECEGGWIFTDDNTARRCQCQS